MSDEGQFREIWADYTESNLGRRIELHVPDEFEPDEWDDVGYLPPERRSDNEIYNWSEFYDFFDWLREQGLLDLGD